ncbi:MAG: glycosyltransferase family 39 protein [Acidobacteriia bacterium]|nr:glycosyltransferase family 39 protein [Terriglobia bacterium]
MQERPTKIFLFSILLMASFFLFFYRLDAIGLVGPDEPRYAEVAKEMIHTGDFVTPHLLGKPWFEKPILYYWCAAGFYSLLGIRETAARLPSSVAALLMILAVLLVPRSKSSFENRWRSAVIVATTVGILGFSHGASTDMLFTSTFTISMVAFLSLLQEERTGPFRGRILLAYGALGLSVLAKGPVGLVLAFLIVFVYGGMTSGRKIIPKLKLTYGIVVLALVGGPWYVICAWRNGWSFLDTFLLQHNLARFATNTFQHSEPLWFYVPVILISTIPWTPFLLLLVSPTRAYLKGRTWRTHPGPLFLYLWIVVPFLFFTIARSKLPGYLLPVLPPIALLLGQALEKESPLGFIPRWAKLSSYFLEPVLLLGVFFSRHEICRMFDLPSDALTAPLGIVLLLSVPFSIWITFSKEQSRVLGISHLVLIAIFAVITSHKTLPYVGPPLSARPVAQRILERSRTPVVYSDSIDRSLQYGLDFYLPQSPQPLLSPEDIHIVHLGKDAFLVEERINWHLPSKRAVLLLETPEIRVWNWLD